MSSALSVVECLFHPDARARAAAACASYVVEPRGGMSVEGGRMTEIGEMPVEWEVVRLGDVAEIKGGKRLPKGHNLLDTKTPFPYLRIVDFKNMSVAIEDLKYLSPETYEQIKVYTIGSEDVYISIAGTIGLAGIIPPELNGANLTENAAKLCNLKNIDKKFLTYILNSEVTKPQINALIGKATQPKLALFRIEKIKLPLPPLPEQRRIAEVLGTVDSAIQKVGGAIESTERLKKGLMQRLLTKGIGHERFKESEVGRVPEEWEVVRLGDISRIKYGLGQPPQTKNDGVPMIRATNINSGKIFEKDVLMIDITKIPTTREVFLKEGDIIVVRSGAYTGDVGLVTKKWEGSVAGYDLIVSSNRDKVEPRFLSNYLLSPQIQKICFIGLKTRSAQPHLNSNQLENISVAFPPLPEQRRIAEILSAADRMLELERRRKEKLERVKKGMMNELLTGRKRMKT